MSQTAEAALFTPVPDPPPRSKTRRNVLILVGVFILGLMFGSGATSASQGPAPVAATVTAAPTTVTETVVAEPETADASSFVPKASDVTLTLKTQKKNCYGEAGCNVTVEVRAGMDVSALPSSGTLAVYYTIKGDEDGPKEGYLEVDLAEGTYDKPTEMLGTKSSKTKLTVKVTEVEYTE